MSKKRYNKRKKHANAASSRGTVGAVTHSQPLATAEAVASYRRQRFNPLHNVTPQRLTRALEEFEYGHLREAALMWEAMADKDDTIKSVKPKREKSISQKPLQIELLEKGDAAERHREVLKDFWNNVKVVNAYDRNEKGGFGRLIKQMMQSVSYRYSAHHIVWDPSPGKLRATFEYVPLYFFENTTGELRFDETGTGTAGVEMDPSEWMVTYGDGLMLPCSIGYLAKRMGLQDWLNFSEKFSLPGVLGKTRAAKGSPEGEAMKNAVQSFGRDFEAVVYGDDGSSTIDLIQANGSANNLPMPAMVERVDRKFASLYRGADLSTMSSRDGEGTGASLQQEESDILEADDCTTISETLQQIDCMVIEWYFGKGVEPLAKTTLLPPVREDRAEYLKTAKEAKQLGVRVKKEDFLDRTKIIEAEDDEEALGENVSTAPASGDEPIEPEQNAESNSAVQDTLDEVRSLLFEQHARSDAEDARRFDAAAIAELLQQALQADAEVRQTLLKELSVSLPDFIDLTKSLEESQLATLVTAYVEGASEEENES